MLGKYELLDVLENQINLVKVVSKRAYHPSELAELSEALAHLSEVYINLSLHKEDKTH